MRGSPYTSMMTVIDCHRRVRRWEPLYDQSALDLAYSRGFEACREMAKDAINKERLFDDTGEPEDAAYNRAVVHCLEAIAALTPPPEQAEPQKPEA